MNHRNADSLPQGKALAEHDGEHPDGLIVLRHGDRVYAWRNCCPHQGRMLNYAPGKFLQTDAGNLMCAAHGAVFDQYTGACIAGPCQGDRLTPVAVSTDPQGRLCFTMPDTTTDNVQPAAVETEP